ncbi:MAG: hypothetical protein JWM93_1775, partial [Frankiales bacterium]|nr:hypothetical protein [Frankiales bacterium]
AAAPAHASAPAPARPDSTSRFLPPTALARERLAVAWIFVLSGVSLGAWMSRVPAIKAAVGASDARWGSIAICTGLGMLAAMLVMRRFMDRIGARPLLFMAVPLQLTIPVLCGLARSPLALSIGLICWGVTGGTIQAAMNAQAVVVERHYQRVIMPSFHACWSAGALVGALLGSGAAKLHVGPSAQFAIIAAALLSVTAGLGRLLPTDVIAKGKPERRNFTPQLVLISLIAFCSSIAEGTSSQWSAVYITDSLGGSESVAALAFAFYSLAMTLGRALGSRVVDRLGRVRTLRFCTAVGAAGLVAGLLTQSIAGALLGFVFFALGLSCVIPTAFSLASNQPGISAGSGVTTIGLASWPASLIGPPLIGYLSDATSLRTAFIVVAVIASAIALLSRGVRDVAPQRVPGSR